MEENQSCFNELQITEELEIDLVHRVSTDDLKILCMLRRDIEGTLKTQSINKFSAHDYRENSIIFMFGNISILACPIDGQIVAIDCFDLQTLGKKLFNIELSEGLT